MGGDGRLPLTRAVARCLHQLMAIKDEYEVARLYSDGRFRQQLAAQFEGDFKLEFHLAPPLLSRAQGAQPPRKIRIGGWLLPVVGWLARGKVVRGTALDLFGRSAERRLERSLIPQHVARIDSLLPRLDRNNLAMARVCEAELLHRLAAASGHAASRPDPPYCGDCQAGLRGR